jgi:hypothetical protein
MCIKRSPAYGRASSLVPHLLHRMRAERSGAGIGETELQLDRPQGFNEKNHCDLELLAEVTRPASRSQHNALS